jgi:hypothetical protein
VIVIRAKSCGCGAEQLGIIFEVADILVKNSGARWRCRQCGAGGKLKCRGVFATGFDGPRRIGSRRLKRIPPLADLDAAKQQERTLLEKA